MDPMGQPVILERHGGVATLTLNRPERGNSLTLDLLKILISTLRDLKADEGLKALCITGAGERSFCTGADLEAITQATSEDKLRAFRYFMEALELISTLPCLSAALVNGDCLGGGVGIALATDFTLISKEARIGTPEIQKGLFPYIISKLMVRKLGAARAAGMAFGGRIYSGSESLALGLASEVCDGGSAFVARTAQLRELWAGYDAAFLKQGKQSVYQNPSAETLLMYLGECLSRRSQ